MDGLDQVSDDAGCWDGSVFDQPQRPAFVEGARMREDARDDTLVRIARTIEGEVIPRLLLAHRTDLRPTGPPPEAVTFGTQTPEQFARVVLAQDEDVALGYVHAMVASGLPLEAVYLDLLAPAARWLGQQWTDDELSFSDVTIALARLQRIMRMLAATLQDPASRPPIAAGPVLLAAMPGEQHMFGVLMLEEFCRRDGLDVICLPTCSRRELIASVKDREPVIVGLSVSVDDRLDEMRQIIREIRKAAPRREILVMVGGRCFNEHPNLVGEIGADFTAVDGREAIGQIHWYMSNRSNSQTKS